MLTNKFLVFAPDSGAGAGVADNGHAAGEQAGNATKQPVTFTPEQQTALNEMFAERGKQGAASALTDLFKTINVKDANELKAIVDEANRLKEAQKTEAEKLIERENALKLQVEQLAKERDGVQAQLKETTLKNAVIAEAQKQNFADVNDAWLHIDRAGITEKDGKFEGIDKLIEAIAKAKPYLIKSQQTEGVGTPRPQATKKIVSTPATPTVRVNF